MSKKTAEKKILPKLLMLHGYRQNEKSFREKTGGLRKSLKNYAEFVFCESPHLVPKLDTSNEETEGQDDRGWWFSSDNKTYNALEETSCELGFQQSLDFIDNIFKTQGPFDGVFAFSQGACLASILCKISLNNSLNNNENINQEYKNIKFKFAILVAGFKSGQSQHNTFYDLNNKINMPTLHVIGETDKVIAKDMSENLLEYFLNPKVFTHSGGHFVPVNSEAKNAFIDFLNQILI